MDRTGDYPETLDLEVDLITTRSFGVVSFGVGRVE